MGTKFKKSKILLLMVLLGLVASIILPGGAIFGVPIIQICIESHDQVNPDIYGDKIVYEDHRSGNWDIYLFDLNTKTERSICTESHHQEHPRIFGDKIIWEDNRSGSQDIYSYNLTTGTETPICTEAHNQYGPAIYGNKIVWSDLRNGNLDIYMYDLLSKTETPICTEAHIQDDPDIFYDKIVWADQRNAGQEDIYMYNLTTLTETAICTEGHRQRHPSIYGNRIVWQDYRAGNTDIYMYDLDTHAEVPICTETHNQEKPDIYGDKIVWHDLRSGNWDIYMYDLARHSESSICTLTANQQDPRIYWGNIVWDDNRNGNWDIFMGITQNKANQRLAGDDRYRTAVEISKKGWNLAKTVVLARGDLFPDALAGAPLAKKYDAPILLTEPTALNDYSKAEINRLHPKDVYILGSEDAVYPKVATDLITNCSIATGNVHRLGGDSRYDTASLIALSLAPLLNREAFIATGENYPDALASASVAAFKGIPILLVRGDLDSVTNPTQTALTSLNIINTYIVGGEDVVPNTISQWLSDRGYHPTRLEGSTRYETCRAIADWAIGEGVYPNTMSVAVGENFPDALAIGPLAAKNEAPVLLLRTDFIPDKINEYMTNYGDYIFQVLVAGGVDVVSETVKNQISAIIGL